MDILQRILEEATASGLSRVITYVLLIPVAMLVGYGAWWYAKRRFKRFLKEKQDQAIQAVKQAPAQMARSVADAAMGTASTVGKNGFDAVRAASVSAAPVVRSAGELAITSAKQGAAMTVNAAQVAAPIAKDIAKKAIDAAGTGAGKAVQGAISAAPIAQRIASSAFDKAKLGAGIISDRVAAKRAAMIADPNKPDDDSP